MTSPAFRKIIIVVIGSAKSGITKFIATVSELPHQTVPDPLPSPSLKPLDYGRLTIDPANVIYLYGISEENPLSAWTFLFDRDDPIGVIVLVDSSQPPSFNIAKMLINNIDADIPFIIAANKRDNADAWDLDAIRVALSLSRDIEILPCVATTGEGVRDLVLNIVDYVLFNPQELDED